MYDPPPIRVFSLSMETLAGVTGDEGTLGLLSAFSKAKNYIEEGRRLENISWRIWYRDSYPSAQAQQRPSSLQPQDRTLSTPLPKEKEKDASLLAFPKLHDPTPSLTPKPMSDGAETPRLSTIRTKSIRSQAEKEANPFPVGQIIARIIPERLVLSPTRGERERKCSSPVHNPPAPPRRVTMTLRREDTDSGLGESSYSSIESNDQEQEKSTVIVIPPSTPPAPSHAMGPRLVIVNATPHPTPPATPDTMHPPAHASLHFQGPGRTTLSPPVMPGIMLPAPAMTMLAAQSRDVNTFPADERPSPARTMSESSSGSGSSHSSSEPEIGAGTASKKFFMPKASPESLSPKPLMPPPISNPAPVSAIPERGEGEGIKLAPSPTITSPSTTTTNMTSPSKAPATSVTSTFSAGSRTSASGSKGGAGRPGHARKGSRAHVAGGGSKPTVVRRGSGAIPERKKSVVIVGSVSGSSNSKSQSRSRERPPPAVTPTATESTKQMRRQSTQAPPPPKAQQPTIPRVNTQPQPLTQAQVQAQLAGLGQRTYQLPLANLAQPALPGANRRRVEIITTSSDFESDSDWSSTSDVENDDEKNEKKKQERTEEEDLIEETLSKAAAEAARQRDFFTKLPKRSYSHLPERTKSGLLTNMFNPEIAQSGPYRSTLSHHDIAGSSKGRQRGGHTMYGGRINNDNGTGTGTPKRSPPLGISKILGSKTAAGTEVAKVSASTYTHGGVQDPSIPTVATPPAPPSRTRSSLALSSIGEGGGGGGYKARGKPADVEMSDSGEEDPTDVVAMGESVARRKLEAMTAKRDSGSGSGSRSGGTSRERDPHSQQAPLPLYIGYPYNLPPDPSHQQPPSISLTTQRRNMYITECGASLLNHMKHEVAEGYNALREGPRFNKRKEGTSEEEKRVRLERNKSWVKDDFHTSGW